MTDKHEQGYYWDEALPEIIEEMDWSGVSREQWDEIGHALNEHVSNARDFMAPVPSAEDLREMHDAPEITRLKDELARAQEQVEIFTNSVKRRRGAREVYIEHGNVMYR